MWSLIGVCSSLDSAWLQPRNQSCRWEMRMELELLPGLLLTRTLMVLWGLFLMDFPRQMDGTRLPRRMRNRIWLNPLLLATTDNHK